MTTIKINGHVAKGSKGILFSTDGDIFTVALKEFNIIMDALLSIGSIEVCKGITLIY